MRSRSWIVALCATASSAVIAFSSGSPICTIDPAASTDANLLTFAVSSPDGWSFDAPTTYTPGGATAISIGNTNPGKQFRGILMWLTRPDGAPGGKWTVSAGFKLCQSSLVHSSNTAKSQQTFSFIPPTTESATLTVHAVVVEKCGLASCRAAHALFNGANIPSIGVMNIDASAIGTRYDPATDGVLLLRYLLGFTGTALTTGAVGSLPSRDAAQIVTHLNTHRALLDVDGDGNVYTHSDGVLIVRYLLGLRDGPLTQGVFSGSLMPAQIAARIAALVP